MLFQLKNHIPFVGNVLEGILFIFLILWHWAHLICWISCWFNVSFSFTLFFLLFCRENFRRLWFLVYRTYRHFIIVIIKWYYTHVSICFVYFLLLILAKIIVLIFRHCEQPWFDFGSYLASVLYIQFSEFDFMSCDIVPFSFQKIV